MNAYAEWAEHARPLQALVTTLVGVGHARPDYLVIGRQITRAKDPAAALRQVFDEIRAASHA